MSDTKNQHNDEHDPVRKLLKQLPPVKASSDFEQRLQRRISSGEVKSESEGFIDKLFRPSRLPAFVYSLATVIVLGTIAYYAFRNAGITPAENIASLQDKEKISPLPPSEKRAPENVVQNQKKEISGNADEKRELLSGKTVNLPENGKDKIRDTRSLQKIIQQPPEAIRADAQSKAMSQETASSVNDQVSSPSAGAVTNSLSVQERTEEKNAAVYEAGKAAEVRAVQSAPVVNAPSQIMMPMMKQKSIMQYQQSVSSRLDSAAIKDSLRLDSLRRIRQRQKQMKKGNE